MTDQRSSIPAISFSVIMPSLNAAATIARAVSSVLAQQDDDWELIIIDDGSTDDTAAAVAPFLDDGRVTFHARAHAGVAAARNFGAGQARGSFLLFLDSDDEVTSTWLADFRVSIGTAGNVGYASCGYMFFGLAYAPKRQAEFSPQPYLSLAGTFAVRSSVFFGIGGYDEALKQSENWEMAARALRYCQELGLEIRYSQRCNMIRHRAKSRSQQRSRDEDRAAAYLHLYEKYATDGVLHGRRERFLLGAAVNFVRAGQIKESRRMFYRNLRSYPTLKNAGRVLCFEIPLIRNRLWNDRMFAGQLTDE